MLYSHCIALILGWRRACRPNYATPALVLLCPGPLYLTVLNTIAGVLIGSIVKGEYPASAFQTRL